MKLRERPVELLDTFLAWGGTRKDGALLVLSALSLVLSFFRPDILPFNPAWIAIILCGLPILLQAIRGLVTEFDIKADVLVSLALIAAVIIGEDFAAGEVAVIMQLGALLEELTVARARAGIEKLVALSPRTARVLQDGREVVVPAESVQVGDRVRVLPGETVPVDGVIVEGQTSIDESVMTGESLPVDKDRGSRVRSGSSNQFGAFVLRAEHVGEDSSLQRMIALVQSADASKAHVVRLADRWATWIVVIALVSAGLTWLVTGELIRAVTILVVFCPCALVLATPTAIVAAIGNATRFGILVRQGDALEKLATVQRICFDKTGTLTRGAPEVVAVESFGSATSHELYALAASAESQSEHPLGKAVVRCWNAVFEEAAEREVVGAATGFLMLPGRGVRASVDGRAVLAGNLTMMHEAHIFLVDSAQKTADAYYEQGCTLIYVAVDGELAGCLALADTLRPTAASTVRALKELALAPVLLTGDTNRAAYHIAAQLGIDEIEAGCLPERKLSMVREFEENASPVCMVGDGINDAPALKQATVGIALGGVGSDIAVDAADIVLVKDDLAALPHLLALSKRMMTTIKLNMGFSMVLNFAAIILAMTAVLDPVTGALVHNLGSVIVIANSALLLRWKSRSGD